jgi:hypothetical protein
MVLSAISALRRLWRQTALRFCQKIDAESLVGRAVGNVVDEASGNKITSGNTTDRAVTGE